MGKKPIKDDKPVDTRGTPLIYELKVTLHEINPPIWRRILVPADISLDLLHQILQITMGWTDSHLHEFVIDAVTYGAESDDMDDDMKHENRYKLSQVVPKEKTRFLYVYDLGDCWKHEILVENIGPPAPDLNYPVCSDGKRAAPPEDCGGALGYEELLKILGDPSHPEHEQRFLWLPGDLDVETFDIQSVNKRLSALAPGVT